MKLFDLKSVQSGPNNGDKQLKKVKVDHTISATFEKAIGQPVVLVDDEDTRTLYVVVNGPPNEDRYYQLNNLVKESLHLYYGGKIEIRFEEKIFKDATGLYDLSALLAKFRLENSKTKNLDIEVRPQNLVSQSDLETFLSNCRDLGYANNSNFKILGLEDQDPPFFWFAFKGSEIVAMSGIQRIEIQKKIYTRGFHRSCVLPHYCGPGGGSLSRRLENSLLFSQFLKPQLDWMSIRGYEGIFITTNNERNLNLPPRGGLARSHKILKNLEADGLVKTVERNVLLRGVYQTLWKMDLVKFNNSRIVCGHERLF